MARVNRLLWIFRAVWPWSAAAKEECASCVKPLYPAERLGGQKIPLPQSCFYCSYCGRQLSTLNYAVLHGAFYCQVHYKLLANGGNEEETTSTEQKCQQRQMAMLLRLGSEPKTQKNLTGTILMREKMQPRLCSLRPEDGLRSAKQARPWASQNKLRIQWPPSKEVATLEDTGRKLSKFGTSKKLPGDSALFRQSIPSGFAHKAPGHKSIAENSRTEKKQRLLPKVTFPKRSDCVSSRFKPEGRTEDLDVLENRVSSTDRKIPGSQARKSQACISEKGKTCQLANMLLWEGSVSTVSPLTSISAKPSAVGSSPFCLNTLQTAKAAQNAGTAVVLPHGSNLAKVSFRGHSLSGRSSGKEASEERNEKETRRNTAALLKARMKLPALTKLDDRRNRKVPEASRANAPIALVPERSEQFGHVGPRRKPEMEDHNPFQTKSEASVYPTEHKDEESNGTKGRIVSASYPDSLEMHDAASQDNKDFQECRNKSLGSIAENTHSASLQGPGKLPGPETLSEEVEKENEMNREGKPERFGPLYYISDQASHEAILEAIPSIIEDVAEIEDGRSVFCSQAEDSENRDYLPSSDPQNDTQCCHQTQSANESLEPVMVVPNNNEDLPGQAGSENDFPLPPQRDAAEGAVGQASEVKKSETFSSREAANGTENQPMGNVNVRSQNPEGSTLQADEGKDIPGDPVRKPPLKKERNPFARVFASKNPGSSPRKVPSGTKNASKKQSALFTLFGYSSDKDKNKKEQPRKTITKSLMVEGSDEKGLQGKSSSSPPNTEENPLVVIQSRNSEANLWDSEGNDQSCSREEQRDISPPVVNTMAFSTETLPAVLDTDSPSDAEVLSGATNPDIPKPSAPNKETVPEHDTASSPLVNFHNPFVTTENTIQSCASSSVETHSITNIASGRDLHDKESPNLADLDSQDLKLKAVSFPRASREGDAHIIEKDHQIPDMLLFLTTNNRLLNPQEIAPQFPPDLDQGGSQIKDKPDHNLSASDESMSQRNSSHQLSERGPPAATESVRNKNILGTGNAGILQHSDQQTCFRVRAGDPFGLGPHDNQAAIDSYSSGRDDLPLLLPSLQCIPELLQDTIQGQAAERCQVASEESHGSSGSMTF